MTQSGVPNHSAGRGVAVALAIGIACLSVAVAAVSLARLRAARQALRQSDAELSAAAAASQASAHARLPENVPLVVCNQGTQPVELLGVISSFRDPQQARMVTFNTSAVGSHTWTIAPHSRELLRVEQDGKTLWDGSTIFFALDVRRNGKELMQVGDALQASEGCVAVLADRT